MEKQPACRCVIVGGADIYNYEFIREKLRDDDYVIFCDSGLRHLEGLQAKASLIVGDFDSHENPLLDAETIILPCEKDDTDSMFAVKEGIRRGFLDFLLIGVIGARLDHSLCNLSALLYLENRGKNAVIIDDYSEMELVGRSPKYIDCSYPYFSLINLFGEADGVTVRNAKYPLENAKISAEYQYGVSNEPLPQKTAEVSVSKGKLLLIKIRA